MQSEFFKGLKVIEMASVLAGPAVGMFFAELGAEVIKIENKTTGGDVTRKWRLPNEDKSREYSAYYCNVNWNKQTHFLNLKEETAQQYVYKLVSDADIVISNFKTKSAAALKMSYQYLTKVNPKIIYGQIHAFGKDSDRTGFDVVLQAEAGFLYMTGESGREPVRMPVALIDLMTAHQLKEALLIAIIKRYRTGEGSYVETSLYECALAALANQATNWLMEQHIPQRMGNQHPNIAPYGDIFYTLDEKPIVIAAGTEHQFSLLCMVLDLQHIVADKRFTTNESRLSFRKELNELLAPAFRQMNQAVIMKKLLDYKIPAGSIKNMQEVFEDEKAQSMILQEVMSDGTISQRVKTVAFKIRD